MVVASGQKYSSPKRGTVHRLGFLLICMLVIFSSLLLAVSPVYAQPSIFVGSLPEAQVSSYYYTTLMATGGTLPYTWTIATGSLPPGLHLSSSTGVISGTPFIAGTYGFVAVVTDNDSDVDQQAFSINVQEGIYEVTVAIGTSLQAGETKVFANGNQIASLQGGQSVHFEAELGTDQTISVESTVAHPTNANIRFKTEVTSIDVNELLPDARFNYYPEYYIEIKTEPPQIAKPAGSDWYKGGDTLRTSALAEVEGTEGTQYRFAHWLLPNGEKIYDGDLNLTVSTSGSANAVYDIYYKLTVTSLYGGAEGGDWYKAGSVAQWGIASDEIPMPGILGFFKGKLKPDNPSGTHVMDGPKAVSITWQPDYTMPFIIIPLVLLLTGLAAFGLYRLWRGPQPKPAPMVPHIQPPPAPSTTVVMIGDTSKGSPHTTREQLMEKFGELLQIYEEEITSTMGPKGVPGIETIGEANRLASPAAIPPTVMEAEVIGEEGQACSFASKKLLRTIATNWKQGEIKASTAPPAKKKTAATGPGRSVVWTREVYNEWEIFECSLPPDHKGAHHGNLKTVYSLLNTVTEEKIYGPKQRLTPPKSHFTSGLPDVEITSDQITPTDQLPTNTQE